MPQSFTTAALQTLFTYPFKAPDWKNKFLTGSLVMLASYIIPIVPGIFVYGYIIQIMRRIIVEGGEPFLPEWDDWDKLFKDGLKLGGVGFIYTLPMLLLLLVGYGLFFVAIFIPIILAGASNEPPSDILALTTVGGSLGGIVCFGLGMILALITFAFLPVAIGHVLATDEFAAAFRLAELWAIFRANLAGFLVAYALLLGFGIVLSVFLQLLFLTIIFCCIYPIVLAPITVYIMIIWSVMFAQAYRDGVEKLRLQTVASPPAP